MKCCVYNHIKGETERHKRTSPHEMLTQHIKRRPQHATVKPRHIVMETQHVTIKPRHIMTKPRHKTKLQEQKNKDNIKKLWLSI